MKIQLLPEITYFLEKKILWVEKNKIKVFINFSFLSKINLTNENLIFGDSSPVLLKIAQKLLFNTLIDLLSCVRVPMEIVGFNHQVKLDDTLSFLIFDLGFSSVLWVEKPIGIFVNFLDTKNKIFELSSFSRRSVILFSKEIRKIKPPNLYTGHGIKYLTESIVRKQIKK